jgi:DNA-binding NarL/FixJ family response regulator
VQAIQEALQGRSYVTPQATQGLVGTFINAPEDGKRPGELSPRQREVLQLLAEGHSMKEIGRILKITPRTVAFHKYTMMEELGIKSSAELVHFAVKQHLVSV